MPGPPIKMLRPPPPSISPGPLTRPSLLLWAVQHAKNARIEISEDLPNVSRVDGR